MSCHWRDVEAAEGQFDFSGFEETVRQALANNTYIALNPLTGNYAPLSWLAKSGVPTVEVVDKKSNETSAFPYYLAPNYNKYWKRFQQKLHDWVKGLPKNKEGKNPIESIQVSQGSTGDLCPWHGTPVQEKYDIPDDVWKKLWVNGTATMIEIHRDLLPDTKLLFNGLPFNNTPEPDDPDAKYWPEYRRLAFDVLKPPNFDVKYGTISHQYMASNELDDYFINGNLTRFPYVSEITGKVEFVRSRGECSNPSPTRGPGASFWMYPTWNSLAMACWDITFGLDIWNPNPAMWSSEFGPSGYFTTTLWRSFQHFHTHAGAKEVASAPGAWIQLRDALDYADKERFPEAEFGPAERTNKHRIKKIIAKYADLGAGVDDPESAMASRFKSRYRKGLNQIGWRIWPTNYGKWMKQIDPLSTSVGRWRVGSTSNLLGQNCRQTVPGRNMSFGLSAGLFGTEPGADAGTVVYVRVAFYDQGHGSWELHYRAPGGETRLAVRVRKTNSMEFVESRVRLPDFACCQGEEVPALTLVDPDARRGEPNKTWASHDPDIFAWVEVMRSPFLYQMAERVLDHEAGLQVMV